VVPLDQRAGLVRGVVALPDRPDLASVDGDRLQQTVNLCRVNIERKAPELRASRSRLIAAPCA
jgi:hypothetical protein